MRSSKKYQEIADSLNTVKRSLGLDSSYNARINWTDKEFMFCKIVDQLCYDFKQHNEKFKEDLFRKECYK